MAPWKPDIHQFMLKFESNRAQKPILKQKNPVVAIRVRFFIRVRSQFKYITQLSWVVRKRATIAYFGVACH